MASLSPNLLGSPRGAISVWKWSRNGAGTLWSKRMSIVAVGRGAHRNRSIQTARCEFQHCGNLLARNPKPLHNLFDRGAVFEVLEYGRHGQPRILENPSSANPPGDTLYCRALGPIQRRIFRPLLSISVKDFSNLSQLLAPLPTRFPFSMARTSATGAIPCTVIKLTAIRR
jgi:hypothetical protein